MNEITTRQFLKRIEELHKESMQIAKRKNADYSGIDDPFRNFKLVEQLGITSVEEGILTRMCDKLSRIANLLQKEGKVNDESVSDTLKDLSNYALILSVYLEQKDANKNSK